MDRPTRHQPPSSYAPSYQPLPTAQPPMQIPFSDPFHTTRDPFLPGAHARRDSGGAGARGWLPTPGNGVGNGHAPPPPPPSNNGTGPGHLSLPFDPSRRHSLGGSPPQYARAPIDQFDQQQQLVPQTSFGSRNMPPPPSSPQMPPPHAASSLYGSAPRGPPTTSPFAGVRDLASFAAHRPATGMSISSMLGGVDDHKANDSPHNSAAAPSSVPKPMHPPSPGRARSSSMREGRRDTSPPRPAFFVEPHAATAFHERGSSEPRRDGVFDSPQLQRESVHSFRNFQAHQPEHRAILNGIATLNRPSSQPAVPAGPRSVEEIVRREPQGDTRFGPFRQYGEPNGRSSEYPLRGEELARQEQSMNHNEVTSQPREREHFGSPHIDRNPRHGMMRFQPGTFGTSMRGDQAGLFRSSFQHVSDVARESIEPRAHVDSRREAPRSSPPGYEMPPFERGRNGFADRPMTFEEHQRMEASQREQQGDRKESDGSVHRAVLNISPELGRKGRNTPQPQAIQGAQPRQSGLTKDNPRLNAFGRMFSGLGSGAGSVTPTPGQDMTRTNSPSRRSPSGQMEDVEMARHTIPGIEQDRFSAKNGSKGGKKGGRRAREDAYKEQQEGRGTPDLQRGGKRLKPTHHHHHHVHAHHHHHHHENADAQAGSFSTLKFPASTVAPLASSAAHHHHHHRAPHPDAKTTEPRTCVHSDKLIESVKDKPRKHLGSQLYSTTVSLPDASLHLPDSKLKYNSESRPLPRFEDKENCTFTIRIPRYYVARRSDLSRSDDPTPFEVICKTRQVWGTDVYTDDSDVLAAAVHSGWIRGDFGEVTQDYHDLFPRSSATACSWHASGHPKPVFEKPISPWIIPEDFDVHITVLILPALETYVSTTQNCIRSREWGRQAKGHDGMSFMILKTEFVDESPGNRFVERGAVGRKNRLAMEESKRREAAAGLVAMFASSSSRMAGNNSGDDDDGHGNGLANGVLEGGPGVTVGA